MMNSLMLCSTSIYGAAERAYILVHFIYCIVTLVDTTARKASRIETKFNFYHKTIRST